MQIELTLKAEPNAEYSARDLSFLLHKHPDHLHERKAGVGLARVFYTDASEEKATAILHVELDPVALVRGKNAHDDGLLSQYVNDRPFVANSFLSVAISRAFAQTMAGKSKDRQALAERELPLTAVIKPIFIRGSEDVVANLFEPLGYQVTTKRYSEFDEVDLFEIEIKGTVKLADLLKHLYVLIPVLDNAKHYWIDAEEIENLLAKGEGWLEKHPAKALIARRSLKNRKGLVTSALARLSESVETDDEEKAKAKDEAEQELEKPIRLHDLRLDTVADILKERNVATVLDLGCGSGKLIQRLLPERSIEKILGIDPSVRALEIANRRLKVERLPDRLKNKLHLQMGSLTYADRRWRDFDAATLVEVIEHIDEPRLLSLARSLFGDARPRLVLMTTPNVEYNALFEGLPVGTMRHADHRFEWTRKEFEDWCREIASTFSYGVSFRPLGPEDDKLGAPSQMAVFERANKGEKTNES